LEEVAMKNKKRTPNDDRSDSMNLNSSSSKASRDNRSNQKNPMTQVEIAKELGVSRTYVTMLMNGKRKPSKAIVNKMKLMDVNIPKLNINGVQEVAGSSPATPISF
jgi:DNA-binding XRE family transcriptional regulator